MPGPWLISAASGTACGARWEPAPPRGKALGPIPCPLPVTSPQWSVVEILCFCGLSALSWLIRGSCPAPAALTHSRPTGRGTYPTGGPAATAPRRGRGLFPSKCFMGCQTAALAWRGSVQPPALSGLPLRALGGGGIPAPHPAVQSLGNEHSPTPPWGGELLPTSQAGTGAKAPCKGAAKSGGVWAPFQLQPAGHVRGALSEPAG